jgi:malate dehydrogenase (oxaloacetate-decarboxylating)
LIVHDAGLDGYKRELAIGETQAGGIRRGSDGQRGLLEVVEGFRPTVLIGTSGQAGAFTQPVISLMARHVDRPIILPLSNPTANCEASPADLIRWTEGRALVASGSPFPDVMFNDRQWQIGQGNNAFIFPGVGLAALAGGLREIGDQVFLAAAKALAWTVTNAELASGSLYPAVSRLREVTPAVGCAVLKTSSPEERREGEIREQIQAAMWEPEYAQYLPA